MDIRVGDTVEMKKAHPCGSHSFSVARSGMDFKLVCLKCGHMIEIPRAKAERGIRRVLRGGEAVPLRAREQGGNTDGGAAGA